MSEFSYELKVSGAISRFKVFGELLNIYLSNTFKCIDEIQDSKKSWQSICDNIIKCSVTLDEKTFDNFLTTWCLH